MNGKIYLHSLLLLLSTFIIFLFVSLESLKAYSLQVTAGCLAVLLLCHRILKPSSFRLAESVISSICVLLVTDATGGISSPLFFLNYLLLFELAVLLEPAISIVLSMSFISFYFFSYKPEIGLFSLLELLAFPLMTPLAMILGKLYLKTIHQREEIVSLRKKISNLENSLVKDELELIKKR